MNYGGGGDWGLKMRDGTVGWAQKISFAYKCVFPVVISARNAGCAFCVTGQPQLFWTLIGDYYAHFCMRAMYIK